MKYFVWVSTLTGPQAQIWHEKPRTGEGKSKEPLRIVELDDDEAISIDNLVKLYPIEAKE